MSRPLTQPGRRGATAHVVRRPRSGLAHGPLAALLSLACLLTPVAGAVRAGPGDQPVVPPQFVISNGLADVSFSTDIAQPGGSSVWLRAMTNKTYVPQLQPVVMNTGSGNWRLRLVVEGSGNTVWFEFSMDGTVNESSPGVGSLDSLTLDGVTMVAGGFDADWSGTVTLSGESSAWMVRTSWRMVNAEPAIDTVIDVQLQAGGSLGFYVSEVVYPTVRVATYGTPGEQLLLPWLGGSLVNDPTNVSLPFKTSLGSGLNFFPSSVSGYYDGQPDSRCFAMAATDMDDYWKDLWVSVGGVGNTRHVQYEMRHVPDDIFDDPAYLTPYAVRLAVFEGDWWDIVRYYRKMLKALTSWYQGPVGSPSHPMPQAMKERVAEIYLQPAYQGDHMDLLALQMTAIGRVMGGKINAVFYGGHAPDSMSHWYFSGGYLPGRPSLVGAVRAGQKRVDLDQVVSPYINGTSGSDYTDPVLQPPITNPTPLQQQVYDSFLLDENGTPRYFTTINGPPRAGYLCPGDTWWQGYFPSKVREIAEFTSMRGAYFDYFLTGACYATDHAHLPGGGNWMYTGRMQQIRDITQPPHDQLCLPIEFLYGRFTEEIDGMHHDPARNVLSAQDYPGTTIPEPMANAVTVPFFHAVYDNVKMSRITAETPSDSGRRSWVEANNVFTFGQIPGLVRPLAELIPAFSDRFVFAPFYNFLDNLVGGTTNTTNSSNSSGGDGSNGFPTAPPWIPQKDSLNVPYLRFLGQITAVLRDHGFQTWHNGTLGRMPSHTVTQIGSPGFSGIPGVEFDPFDQYQTNSPVYLEEMLVPGMFVAPGDLPDANASSLAFVCANPWVDPFNAATFSIDFSIVPSDYPGWNDSESYAVSFYDGEGGQQVYPGVFSGTFNLSDVSSPKNMAPGDIGWWVLRKVPGT